uniref:Minor tail protein n=1 Tax=Streptomyces phage Scarif TaxID=3158858 RepID=A0AAU7GXG7_9CAUD
MISFVVSRSGKRTEDSLRKMRQGDIYKSLTSAAQLGVRALASAVPKDSGLAADSWSYEIERSRSTVTIKWLNTDIENGFPVAIMLQYGHGTGTGGYVQGQDYINPAMRPIFDQIADQVWRAVTSA